MVIPDDESTSKSYHLSKFHIHLIIGFTTILLLGIVGVLYYYIPKISEYSALKKQHELFVEERMKVLELTRDLERLGQMDAMVRQSLGAQMDIDERPLVSDTLTGTLDKQEFNISFIDNIPSVMPIQGYVSQSASKDGIFIKKKHQGIDIVAKEGDPIKAAASGLVVFSGWTYEYGNLVIIYHGDDYFTHYGHNMKNFKQQMDRVDRGEVIGLVGNTGVSSGPHLHFEVWKRFTALDPLIFFPEYKATDLTTSNE